jgi:hypothetical protein
MGGRARWLGAPGWRSPWPGCWRAAAGRARARRGRGGLGARQRRDSGRTGRRRGPDAAAAAAPDAAAKGSTAESTAAIALRPALIRTAELTVVVDDVPAEAAAAGAAARPPAARWPGTTGPARADAHATLVLKVPPEKMDAMLDQLGRLRARAVPIQQHPGRDPGRRRRRRQGRLDAGLDPRVRAILSQAERIGDVVSVEGELSRRTTELESLQAGSGRWPGR